MKKTFISKHHPCKIGSHNQSVVAQFAVIDTLTVQESIFERVRSLYSSCGFEPRPKTEKLDSRVRTKPCSTFALRKSSKQQQGTVASMEDERVSECWCKRVKIAFVGLALHEWRPCRLSQNRKTSNCRRQKQFRNLLSSRFNLANFASSFSESSESTVLLLIFFWSWNLKCSN